jgi:hypothetical protein
MKNIAQMIGELALEDVRKSGRCYIRKNGADLLEHLVGASWETVVFKKDLPPTGGSNVKKPTP